MSLKATIRTKLDIKLRSAKAKVSFFSDLNTAQINRFVILCIMNDFSDDHKTAENYLYQTNKTFKNLQQIKFIIPLKLN